MSILAAQLERGAARQFGVELVHDLLDAGADAAQVAAVHVGVHVEHRLHVVVVDDLRRHAAADVDQIGKQLRAARRRARIAVGERSLVGPGADAGIDALAEPASDVGRRACSPR